MSIKFGVDSRYVGQSASDFLQREIPAAPVAYLNQLFKKGKVLHSGRPLQGGELLGKGMELDLPDSSRLHELILLSRQQPAAPVILFEDNLLLIADKPAGLSIHAGVGHETENLTAYLQQRADNKGKKYRISAVQRLDLESSGACLFGKGRKALSELGKLMMDRQLNKSYLALVAGEYSGPTQLCSEVLAKGKIKQARCQVSVFASNRMVSLLKVDLLTGRQHQIRQQLAQQDYPLFGDHRYHGPCPPELSRMFLHSYKLSFHHPFGGEKIAVTAPLPSDLNTFLHRLDLCLPAD